MNYKKHFYDFLRTLVVVTLIVIALSFVIFSIIPEWHYPPVYPFLLAFFFIATLLIYHFMLKALQKRPARFVNIFVLTTMLKLLLFMVVMVVYALLNREVARQFVVSFFLLYIIYTVMEVISILKVNKEIWNNGSGKLN
jgi:hypothetical protein